MVDRIKRIFPSYCREPDSRIPANTQRNLSAETQEGQQEDKNEGKGISRRSVAREKEEEDNARTNGRKWDSRKVPRQNIGPASSRGKNLSVSLSLLCSLATPELAGTRNANSHSIPAG
ncbi:hypothetical protein HN011_009931 [Eciton burchellii]|nr:hypothetical protein HN011_009931 [Eciton burchellii]